MATARGRLLARLSRLIDNPPPLDDTERFAARGRRGRRLQRCRGEVVERTFAHMYETGGMRRVWVRGHENVRKRVLLQAAACNIGLFLRSQTGIGTPRSQLLSLSFVIVPPLPPRRSGSVVSVSFQPPMLPSPTGGRLGPSE